MIITARRVEELEKGACIFSELFEKLVCLNIKISHHRVDFILFLMKLITYIELLLNQVLYLVKQECEHSNKVIVQKMDLNEIGELKKLAKELNQKHKIDILINNGGTSMREEFKNLELKMVSQMMNVNYLSAVTLSRYIGKFNLAQSS